MKKLFVISLFLLVSCGGNPQNIPNFPTYQSPPGYVAPHFYPPDYYTKRIHNV